jgi:hypothetical protein
MYAAELSNPEVPSSTSIMDGFPAISQPMLVRLRSPPLTRINGLSAQFSKPISVTISPTRASRTETPTSPIFMDAANARWSRTVR